MVLHPVAGDPGTCRRQRFPAVIVRVELALARPAADSSQCVQRTALAELAQARARS